MASKTKAKKVAMPLQRKKTDASQAFDQKQIQEFKEAFTIMDQNKDGIIDKSDLREVYAMMGQIPNDSQIDEMLKEAPGQLNFGSFLSLFGNRLTGTDPDETVMGAFQLFDHLGTGFMTEELLLRTLKNPRGEPLKEDEIKAMYKGNPPISNGQVDINAFVKLITTGGQDELNKANA
jgi:Ca2+-binding EF-hand superfamily protein